MGSEMCIRDSEDSDEEVDWVIELISLDYTTEEVVEEESEDDDSGE